MLHVYVCEVSHVTQVFAVAQTSAGAFGSVAATGISCVATQHPRFEFFVKSASVGVHMSQSIVPLSPAISSTVICQHAATDQPLITLVFESKRSSSGINRPVSVTDSSSSSSSSSSISSELALATFLDWKDSESRTLLEKQPHPDFPTVAAFTLVGAVNGARVCMNLDDLFRINFLRNIVGDTLQLLQRLQAAGFTPQALFSTAVVPSSPYHTFCEQVPSHPFVRSPPPPPPQTETSAGNCPPSKLQLHIRPLVFPPLSFVTRAQASTTSFKRSKWPRARAAWSAAAWACSIWGWSCRRRCRGGVWRRWIFLYRESWG